MDGTLVDTEGYWMAAETELVESFGGTWTHEQALALVGKGLEGSAAILQAAGVRMPVEEIVSHLTGQVIAQIVEHGNPFRPGAVEMLTALRAAGVKTALVTMSLRRMADVVVSQMDAGIFDAVIGGDEVTRPKPFPDPYLQACAVLGVAPDQAVAIEDSPTGVRSAVSAGVVTVGVPLMVSLVGTGADTVWPTLAGRTPRDLAEVHSAHRAGTPA